MAPIKPHWVQPSHPEVQEVIINEAAFTTKSISRVALPPFGLFAKLEFPPCTVAPEATYATVQTGRDSHLDLNSDLLYINHSCEPSLIFDTANSNVVAGPKGLQPGDELTFFYPSTEWYMAQPFDCLCGTPTCRGRIAGARDMTATQLDGLWLNGHIRELLEERENPKRSQKANGHDHQNGHTTATTASADQTVLALRDALAHAEKVVDAARLALVSYVEAVQLANGPSPAYSHNGSGNGNGAGPGSAQASSGAQRRGPTSRELSGEMGGDTSVHV